LVPALASTTAGVAGAAGAATGVAAATSAVLVDFLPREDLVEDFLEGMVEEGRGERRKKKEGSVLRRVGSRVK